MAVGTWDDKTAATNDVDGKIRNQVAANTIDPDVHSDALAAVINRMFDGQVLVVSSAGDIKKSLTLGGAADDAARGTVLTNAVAAAVSGDTLIVPKADSAAKNLEKAGVNYYFQPGALVYWEATTTEENIFRSTDKDETPWNIYGCGRFEIRNTASIGNNSCSAIHLEYAPSGAEFADQASGSPSVFDYGNLTHIECESAESAVSGSAGVYVAYRRTVVDINRIEGTNYDGLWVNQASVIGSVKRAVGANGASGLELTGLPASSWATPAPVALQIDHSSTTGASTQQPAVLLDSGHYDGTIRVLSAEGDQSRAVRVTSNVGGCISLVVDHAANDTSTEPTIEVADGATVKVGVAENEDAAGRVAELGDGSVLYSDELTGDIYLTGTTPSASLSCHKLTGDIDGVTGSTLRIEGLAELGTVGANVTMEPGFLFDLIPTTGINTELVSGTAGTNGWVAMWNIDGDLVNGKVLPAGPLADTSSSQSFSNKTLAAPSITGVTNFARTSSTSDPTTTEYPNDGDSGVHKNTTSGNRFWVHNDGGTIVSVQLS